MFGKIACPRILRVFPIRNKSFNIPTRFRPVELFPFRAAKMGTYPYYPFSPPFLAIGKKR